MLPGLIGDYFDLHRIDFLSFASLGFVRYPFAFATASSYPTTSIASESWLDGTATTNALVFDEVVGDCGLSYVGAEKGANDIVTYESGYVVRDAVSRYTWAVTALGFISGETDNYARTTLTGPELDVSGTLTAIGPGNAFVPGLSQAARATPVDGAVCYSGGPSVGFP